MTNEEKILGLLEQQGKALERLEEGQQEQKEVNERLAQGQARLEQGQIRLEQGQAQHKTLLKVLEAGQNDIRENMATKADVQDIKAEQVKLKRRIENLEEHTKTPNPHKN